MAGRIMSISLVFGLIFLGSGAAARARADENDGLRIENKSEGNVKVRFWCYEHKKYARFDGEVDPVWISVAKNGKETLSLHEGKYRVTLLNSKGVFIDLGSQQLSFKNPVIEVTKWLESMTVMDVCPYCVRSYFTR